MKKYLTKYEVRWAIIFSLVALLWAAFEFEMGWHGEEIGDHKYYTFLFLIPAVLVYILFILDKRNHRFKKRFKFKHAFFSCLGLTLLIVLFSIPAQFLIHGLVSPDFVANMRDYLVSTGELTRKSALNFITTTSFILFFPLMYFSFGVLMSFILAFAYGQNSKRRVRS